MITSYVNIQDLILTILAVVVLLIMLGSVYALLVAIFKYIFSSSDDGRTAAQKSLRFMIIGLILTVVLLLVFPLIFQKLNIPGYEVFTASSIFARVGDIVRYIFGLGGLVQWGGSSSPVPTGTPGSYTL